MTNNYAAKPSFFMNSALLSGALAASLAALWSIVSIMLAA
jgi:hypothetical protein